MKMEQARHAGSSMVCKRRKMDGRLPAPQRGRIIGARSSFKLKPWRMTALFLPQLVPLVNRPWVDEMRDEIR